MVSLWLAALDQAGATAAQIFIDNSSKLSVNQSTARNEFILAKGSSEVDEAKLDEARGDPSLNTI